MENEVLIKDIQAYYSLMDTDAIIGNNIIKIFFGFIKGRKKSIIVSDSRVCRYCARFLRMRSSTISISKLSAQQYFAIDEILLLLANRNIPVYYFNRIGIEKPYFEYSKAASRRMKEQLSFPIMLENQDKYITDLKELFGSSYSKDYISEIGKIPQVIKKGDKYCHEDCIGKYVNVIEGRRITNYQPEKANRTIHIYGRCGAFGYAVEDKDTLPSQIQKKLIEHGFSDIRVENHGLWGGTDEYLDHNFICESLEMSRGDIVVFYKMHIDKRLLKKWQDKGLIYKEITHEWHQHPEAKWCFFDRPGHMNNVGYEIVADIILRSLIDNSFASGEVAHMVDPNVKSDYLNRYLKDCKDNSFNKEVEDYTNGIINNYPISNGIRTSGSIVMNCNPFTNGHRYLIEYASKKVDRLYIFVVEQNRSFFTFEDRLEMVKKGTKDLENVVVVPSGKFIISSYTFPEYFMKDYVKEKNFDVSMDVETFCKYIAPPLGIKIRFAGEEPFDPVTLNYNEYMRRILPKYDMEFCEIPRVKTKSGKVINATQVRKYLEENNLSEMKEYVPLTTLEILETKYCK